MTTANRESGTKVDAQNTESIGPEKTMICEDAMLEIEK